MKWSQFILERIRYFYYMLSVSQHIREMGYTVLGRQVTAFITGMGAERACSPQTPCPDVHNRTGRKEALCVTFKIPGVDTPT